VASDNGPWESLSTSIENPVHKAKQALGGSLASEMHIGIMMDNTYLDNSLLTMSSAGNVSKFMVCSIISLLVLPLI